MVQNIKFIVLPMLQVNHLTKIAIMTGDVTLVLHLELRNRYFYTIINFYNTCKIFFCVFFIINFF